MEPDPFGELGGMLNDLLGQLDDLERDTSTSMLDRFGGLEKLNENLNDELQEVRNVVAGLLDRARGCPADEWPATRAELLSDMDQSFETLRESYGILHTALDERDIPMFHEVSEGLRSAENCLYWLRRRRDEDSD